VAHSKSRPDLQAFQEVLNLLHRLEHVHLAVASRVRTPGLEAPMSASSVVVLQQLSQADGLQLLESHLPPGHQWSADGKEQEAAEQLVKLVQSNPLTLSVAAGLVSRGHHSWEVSSLVCTCCLCALLVSDLSSSHGIALWLLVVGCCLVLHDQPQVCLARQRHTYNGV